VHASTPIDTRPTACITTRMRMDWTRAPCLFRAPAPATAEEHLREETRRFNVMLRERPADVSLWFRFVEFQVICYIGLICYNVLSTLTL
jgi:hypothetical protein